MTVKEAILKVLRESNKPLKAGEIYEVIKKENYYDFGDTKTPINTVHALACHFIIRGDSRVKRKKGSNGVFVYFANEEQLQQIESSQDTISENPSSYQERDLHKLLSTYLHRKNVHSKTIYHEKSAKSDAQQRWIHPDMVGTQFLKLQSDAAHHLINTLDKSHTLKIFSYEIKKSLSSDTNLKEAYFQAVSNSSWANYGYLVSFEINDDLLDEMQRLNEAFGIGVIHLKSNPFESRVLFESTHRELDFKTIDKLCRINPNFQDFVKLLETILTAGDKHISSCQEVFFAFCDEYFKNNEDENIKDYCLKNHIPYEDEE